MSERRVYLLDCDKTSRSRIRRLLEREKFIVRTFSSYWDFKDEFTTLKPGCVLIEPSKKIDKNIENIKFLHDSRSDICIILLYNNFSIKDAVRMMKSGVIEIINKEWSDDEITEYIRNSVDELLKNIPKIRVKEYAESLISQLSERQYEILKHISFGKLNKNIAFETGLSVRTIEMHRNNILKKLNVRSIGDALQIFFIHLGAEYPDDEIAA